jgi:DNA-binding response OmpR family regulator
LRGATGADEASYAGGVARIVVLASDLLFASRVEAALAAAGHEVELKLRVEDALAAAGEADVVIADLHAGGLDPAAFAGELSGKPLLGYYAHTETDLRQRAEEAGFSLVVPRSRMAREMSELVARLAGT